MADTNPKNRAGDLAEDPKNDANDVRDEEFEIPDPEQVERDRKQSEELYEDDDEASEPAA